MLTRLTFPAFVPTLFLCGIALAEGVSVRFDPSSPEVGPYPTDALTTPDWDQKTRRRINLPVPDCIQQRSACELTKILNEYDGFNPNPRIGVRFSGPVDLESLRRGVFLVALENMTAEEPGTNYAGTPISINQLIWDPKSHSLFAKPDNVLDQHRRYALIVTSAVRDTRGDPVGADPAFVQCITRPSNAYCGDLADHLAVLFSLAEQLGGSYRIVGASLFTTLSATAWLEQARDRLPLTPPAVLLAGPRSLFPVQDIASVVLRQHIGVSPPTFNNGTLVTSRMAGIRALAFGSYRSPNYLVAQDKPLWPPNRFRMIATIPTATTLPPPAGVEEVHFQATIPDSPKPAGGYPVVIAAHGSPGHKFNPTGQGVAQSMAVEGLATISITATGQGYGPESKLVITEKSGVVTEISAGGRGVDMDGNGTISSSEGCELVRDCGRQTVLDMLQLVKAIQMGIDLDGDGTPDLDPGRIYYHGFSFGGNLGTLFAAVEPSVAEVVLTVAGGSVMDLYRWSPLLRPGVFQQIFGGRTPLLAPNAGTEYEEDYVLRDQPVKVSNVEGALELQDVVESVDWLTAPGDQLHYAAHLRASTLPGVPIKRVLFQMCLGDQTVPNPTNSALIRAARAPEWAVLYRHDLARAAFPELPASAHTFLVPGAAPASVTVAQAAQRQAARFYSTGQRCGLLDACIPDMSEILVPVFGKNLFEVPLFPPEELGFLTP